MNWRDWFKKSPAAVGHEVKLYSRRDCPLCDDAMATLRKHARRHRLEVEVIDIEGNAELEKRFGMEIPVVFIDGRKRFFGQVDEVLLRRILEHPAQGDAE